MDDLETVRQTIDEADREMAALFVKRMEAVRKIAAYKAAHGIPVRDEARERAVIEKNVARIANGDLRDYYVSFLQNLMEISRRYQRKKLEGVRVAFAGVEGAFANIAAKRIFPDSTLVSYADFASACHAVENGDCDCCVLPIENSYAGEVGQVTDLLFATHLYVNGVYDLPVRHQLLGIPGTSVADVKKVVSHPQALQQCAEYIRAHGFETESASNTAVAAQTVAGRGDKSVAAIASDETAALYGLTVLDHDINAGAVNTTRFAVFSGSDRRATTANDTFILLFTVNNEVGALAKAVNIICAHGYNMRVLRSRPVKDIPWQYYFYVEAEGDHKSEEGTRMLKALSVCCDKLRVAGHFAAEPDLSGGAII